MIRFKNAFKCSLAVVLRLFTAVKCLFGCHDWEWMDIDVFAGFDPDGKGMTKKARIQRCPHCTNANPQSLQELNKVLKFSVKSFYQKENK